MTYICTKLHYYITFAQSCTITVSAKRKGLTSDKQNKTKGAPKRTNYSALVINFVILIQNYTY